MTFRVRGVLDGAAYEVELDGPEGGPVAGSRAVGRLVTQYEGREVKAGPTGPMVKVKASDPASVLALLTDRTSILSVSGDVPPAPGGPRRIGVVD